MTELRKTLAQIFVWLEQNYPHYASQLQPGLSREQIESLVKTLPFQLSKEIHKIYQWKNGTPHSTFTAYLAPGYRFLPLKEAIRAYYDLQDCYDPSFFSQFWFPIFEEGINNIFTVGSQQQEDHSIILDFSGEDGLAEIYHSSLEKMILVTKNCFEVGAYYFKPEKYNEEYLDILYVDRTKLTQVVRKYDPVIIENVLEKLEQALNSCSYDKFCEVALGVRRFREPKITGMLIKMSLLSPSDTEDLDSLEGIRLFAISLLGDIGGRRAFDTLSLLKEDTDSDIQQAAQYALSRLEISY